MGPWGRKGPVLGGGKGKRGYRDQERGKGGLFVFRFIWFGLGEKTE